MTHTISPSQRLRCRQPAVETTAHNSVPSEMRTAYSVLTSPLVMEAITPLNLFSALHAGASMLFCIMTHGVLTSAVTSRPCFRQSVSPRYHWWSPIETMRPWFMFFDNGICNARCPGEPRSSHPQQPELHLKRFHTLTILYWQRIHYYINKCLYIVTLGGCPRIAIFS